MQTYNSLVELARICARNARLTSRREVAVTLWKVAREYQDRAAKLNCCKHPEIGGPPPWLNIEHLFP